MVTPGSSTPGARNLPRQFTNFIGRKREIERACDLLTSVPLLTLIGPGGVGKTRLALQIAGEAAARFEHGVRWVSLAPLTGPEQVVPTIAAALGVEETPSQTLLEGVAEALSAREMLLVLDNFEHLLGAAQDIAYLLASAHRLTLLVTSRMALHLYGEQEFPVPPMQTPAPNLPAATNAASLSALEEYEAVALFVARARAVRPDFALTEGNAPEVVEICRRLDSLPLAIELAAARCKVLLPRAILARLESGLALLAGGPTNLPTRQQTLRNTIGWSYDLLDEQEKRLFRELSVFVDGSTLEAVEAVCHFQDRGTGSQAGTPLANPPSLAPLDLVQSLAGKSLVRIGREPGEGGDEAQNGDYRVAMLETIREYAREQLDEETTGPARKLALGERHAECYLRLAEESHKHMGGAEQGAWLRRLEADHGNLRSALVWARDNGRWDLGLKLAGALGRFWDVRGHWSEGREWLAIMLAAHGDDADPSLARAHHAAGQLARRQGDYAEARAHLQSSLDFYREAGDRHGTAASLNTLGYVVYTQSDLKETDKITDEALAIYREIHDRPGEADMISLKGMVATRLVEFDRARALLDRSLRIYDELGDRWSVANALNSLGVVLSVQTGHYSAARKLYERSLAIFRELGERRGTALTLNGVGEALRSEGDYASAMRYYEESLAIYRELGDKWGIAMSLHNQGHATLLEGDSTRAAALFLDGLQLDREIGNIKGVSECLAGLAGVATANRQARRAAWLIGKAEATCADTGTEFDPTDQAELDRHSAKARAALGEATFSAARSEGRNLSLDEVLALATAEPARSPTAASSGASATQTGKPEQPPHSVLTRRELEVLRLVATGLTDAQVAEHLTLSPQTVHAHLRSVYSKLNLANRLEATRYAIEHKLT